MTRIRRRIVAVALAATALALLPAGGAGAAVEAQSTWVCLGVEHIDLGVCLGNPLPDDLPPLVPTLVGLLPL